MTAPVQENVQPQEQKQNDKEYNFRALENQLKQERQARVEAERKAEEALKLANDHQMKKEVPAEEDEDDYNEPYVDHKRLNKKLSKFGQNTKTDIQKAMEMAKVQAKEELKQEMWLEQHPDFYDVMQNHAVKFAEKAPHVANTILRMPDSFERQQLVYHNIKEFGLDKPEQKASTIQEKVDANKRTPYYQPTGVATAPYSQVADYSSQGQKQAYQKMKELQSKLRI
jgi:hypothetical protein